MRKVFIDGGAYNGNSTQLFLENYPNSGDYEIHSFECNTKLNRKYGKDGWQNSIKIYNEAIWIKDGKVNFYLGANDGSTLMENKRTGKVNYGNAVKVPCIDFSKWIMDNFSKDDYIILKLDIEGAEYKVLDKMMKDGSFNYINKFYAEWHWHKINMKKEDHLKIFNKVEENLHVYYWDAKNVKEIRGKNNIK